MNNLNTSQADVADSYAMLPRLAADERPHALKPRTWRDVLAATTLFAFCCAVPVLIFPGLSAPVLVATIIISFVAIASFAAYRIKGAQAAFEKRLCSLEQQREASEQRASGAEQRALEAEHRALEAEQRASEFEQKASDAEQRASGAEQRASEALNRTVLYDEYVSMSREWEATFDALPEGAFLFDEVGRLSRINRAGVLLENSQEAASLDGIRCCDMFWRVEDAAECIVERALMGGETVEVEVLTGAESDHPVLVIVVPIKDARGVATGSTVVIARDISELRRAEAEAFEHKSFMASLADLAPDEIYTLDSKGRFTWMNERAEATNNLMPTSLFGRHFHEIVAAESREMAQAHLQRTLAGEDMQWEVQVVRADGTVRYVEAHTSPRWKDGQVAGVLVFLRDMTERRRTHERMAQSDKLRAVGELAAGVAHNLNNALTVIQGRAQLLLMRSTDEATSKSLETITRAVADGSQTLRRILDFARRDPARDFVPVDLAELIASSVEIAKPKWQNKTTASRGPINVHVENQDAVYVLGEAAELREVVLNLLFNAVDALQEGGGIIETGTRAEIDAACFWVADTGRGMPPEIVERIFEPFYTTKGEKGTGLGLSASHGIIARHGGRIMVVSEPGEGTRFEVRLPLSNTKSGYIKKTVMASASPIIESQAARILIVEDEEKVRALLTETFEAAGHTVVAASSGTEALEQLGKTGFDLVICDVGLPEISGLHVARWIKKNRPATPCILATGWTDMITPEDYEKGRIDAVFKKPFTVAEVLDRATQLIPHLHSNEEEPAPV